MEEEGAMPSSFVSPLWGWIFFLLLTQRVAPGYKYFAPVGASDL
jgi:hypothetical protein